MVMRDDEAVCRARSGRGRRDAGATRPWRRGQVMQTTGGVRVSEAGAGVPGDADCMRSVRVSEDGAACQVIQTTGGVRVSEDYVSLQCAGEVQA